MARTAHLHRTVEKTYDEIALDILLDTESPKRRNARLAALSAHAEGRHACPDCGDEGPHDVQSYMGDTEFACRACGMQHLVPEFAM